MFDSHDTWNAIYNRSNLWMQNTMKLRHLCSIVATHEASFTMRGATGVTHQCRQLLCLPRKWQLSWLILVTCETSFTMGGATDRTLQRHQILLLHIPKYDRNLSKRLKHDLQCAAEPNMIREWSDHEPSPQSAAQPKLLFALATSILYWKKKISRSGYHSKSHLRLPRKVTVELHQVLLLPTKVTLLLCWTTTLLN